MSDDQLTEVAKERAKLARSRMIKSIIAIILFGIVSYFAFNLPLPDKMKRSFNKEECEEQGGTWNLKRSRCTYKKKK